MRIDPLVQAFERHLRVERGLSPKTREGYAYYLRKVFTNIKLRLARRGVEELELRHLTRRRLQAEVSAATDGSIRNCFCAIRAFFRYLSYRGIPQEDLGQRLLVRKLRQRIPRYFTKKEAYALIREPQFGGGAAAWRDAAMMALMYEGGLRAAEVCSLDLASLRWDCPRDGFLLLRVLGKGNKERDVPVRAAIPLLRAWLEVRAELAVKGETALFVKTLSGTRYNGKLLWATVRKWGRKAGIEAHPHRFRHTCATHLLWGGADLLVVQEHLGHKRLETTRQYLKTNPRRVLTKGILRHPLNQRRNLGVLRVSRRAK